ncbi:MAG: hypothetical protein H6622_18005 [Halobacteriovoraceae bacterium]|nr:hypothetical protein [Halobacteriovoraceae bacterium]
MNILKTLILNEKKLWGKLGAIDLHIDGLQAQASKEKNKLPFLNLALPFGDSFEYSKKNLQDLLETYAQYETDPYVIKEYSDTFKTLATEDLEYFMMNYNHLFLDKKNDFDDYSIIPTDNLLEFAQTVQKGFEFPETFTDSFYQRMQIAASKLDAKYFLLKNHKKTIGCVSYFRINKSDLYYGMNTCIFKNYRRLGLMSFLLIETIRNLKQNVYFSTKNENMKKLFLKIGSISSGRFLIYKARDLLESSLYVK